MPNEVWSSWLGARMRRQRLPTNRDLARASGVSDSVISRWRADGTTPTIPQLRRLVAPLDVALLDLLIVAGHLDQDEVLETQVPEPAAGPARRRADRLDPDLLAMVERCVQAAVGVQRARDAASALPPRDRRTPWHAGLAEDAPA